MVFYSLIGYVLSPIGSLITSNQTIQEAMIAADRLFQIMDLEQEQNDEQKITLETEMIGDITFENVSFRYGSRKQVFESLNLIIEKGKTTAIIGESGSGKTTLISLLQHIYPIQSGQIRIGSYDIAQISNQSLRRRVGTVPQQIELFAGTIVENIAIGDLQPDILIFDEATSSLDSISEKYVKQTLDALAGKGKTILIIAHRLSTVKRADRIVVIDKGQVVETGNHKELCSMVDGIYKRLWREQVDEID